MLRIVTEQRGDEYRVSLHGKLAGEWVGVLERYWRSIVDLVPSARVVTTLSDVSFIDADGERLLEQMWRQGTDLQASGCMNRYVIDKIRDRVPAGPDLKAAPATHGDGRRPGVRG
jgi:hypothetical protein